MSYAERHRVIGAEADAEVSSLTARATSAEVKVTSLNSELATVKEDLAETDADLAAALAEVKRLRDLYEPAPPAPDTLMGVTVTGAVRKEYTDLHPNVEVSRVFAAGTTSWANESQHKAFPKGKWACSNSYALSEAALPKMLASIPDADIAKIVGWADGHELEHPDKKLRPADVKARVKRTAPIIRDHGLTVVWCMMGYSLRNDDWLQWVDPEDVDMLAFDKYNSGNKKTPPVYQDPAAVVGNAVQASKRFGKPWAFWETGTNRFGDVAPRVKWVTELRAEIVRNGGRQAIWFDRKSTSGSSWDATLDRPSAEAWLL